MEFADTFVAGNTIIEIIFDDITNANTEIIVNSVCNHIHIGRGVSGAINERAGQEIYDELRNVSKIFYEGQIYLSSAGKLPYKYIFHAISSNCYNGTNASILKSCVENTLKIAREKKIKSIGFPALGTGDMNFNINDAAEILINTVINDCFVNDNFERIVFYLFRPDAFTSFFRKAVKATIHEQQINKHEKNRFVERINNCELGLNHQSEYESIVADVLKNVFVPPLLDYQQIKRQNGRIFIDLIFPNYCNEGFWNIIDKRYDVKNVIVTCFNEKNPNIEFIINPLNQYFEKNLYGKFGIILCREKNNSPEYERAIFLSNKKYNSIILSIDDFDVSQLVELKNSKYDPEKYLQRKLSEYLNRLNDINKNVISNISDVVREFMLRGELQNAINELIDYSKNSTSNLSQDIILLSTRNKMNENNYHIKGIINYADYQLEYNRIAYAIEFKLNEI